MKKAVLLVVAFLFGIATQTFAQRHQNVVHKTGTYDRYYNSQEIQFVENGLLFSLTADGSFNFRELRRNAPYSRLNRRQHTAYYGTAPGHVAYMKGRRSAIDVVRWDRFGRVRSIGDTYITYKRNGKVRSIGRVHMDYHRGKLVQVGNLEVLYNRRGFIRNTKGHVNKYNKKYWHDDWYIHNDDWNDDRRTKRKKSDRKRVKKIK